MGSTTTIDRSSFKDAAVHAAATADDKVKPLDFTPISADSHILEPPNCYIDHIDPAFRDRAPHVVKNEVGADVFIVPGMDRKIRVGGLASAGVDPRKMDYATGTFETIPQSSFDGKRRVADQDLDGVGGEIIYPSVGMMLCNHADADFKKACFDAYNLWLQEFQSAAPTRIFGMGQTAVRSVEEAIADFEKIREMGFRGVMMPGEPATEFDYDDRRFDPLWQASIDLKLPLSFHILTSSRDMALISGNQRGTGNANTFHGMIRANQDLIALFIWSRIFERFPDLKLICVEADAGWAPHFMYRMDHYYNRHRHWSGVGDMTKLPSDFFSDNVYLTFQDDFVAFNSVGMLDPRRLLWANDFPHGDFTWPWSQQMLARQTANLTDEHRKRILRDNVVELYDLPV